jgi:hypothetical protein
MKILILRQPQPPGYPNGMSGGACYSTDMLLNGLRSKFGNDVVEYERSWWMYDADFGEGKLDPVIYCPVGYGIYRSLGDDSCVDRTDIENKIKNKYFDLIIFGYIHYGLRPGSWELVSQYYDKDQIAFIDGTDLSSYCFPEAIGKAVYFKRELVNPVPGVFPISFAMPKEKILTIECDKDKVVAPCDPRDRSTYIFKTEESYYRQYAESMFGITTMKAGWDCLRHYEIMANNCVPLFLDIEQCPEQVMTTLPKEQLVRAVRLFREKGLEWFTTDEGKEVWYEINEAVQSHFIENCTTEKLADYVLSNMRSAG